MERYLIDRFEENIVICEKEDGTFINIKANELLSLNPKEGDYLVLVNNIYKIDVENTDKRKEEIKKRMINLFE